MTERKKSVLEECRTVKELIKSIKYSYIKSEFSTWVYFAFIILANLIFFMIEGTYNINLSIFGIILNIIIFVFLFIGIIKMWATWKQEEGEDYG